ncbi:hypothetical protein MNVI_28210 [Mycobacterium noviomagense]|uniref:DUF3499 domain-containing protein n=1 Tax=Mycobacterium noviomagense TaxID=459858 RepID=A0A7I7PFX1_9MYCO|nr:hypothetical protein BST37_07925 [Mycobacterium noviomagense]BBY07503.1 hypothetical protein MNVI_28210 [Mycobacterium noviomagense]
MRVSGTVGSFARDSLSTVTAPRRCCRPGCPHYAVATLTFVYSDSTAVVGPLATAREPHSWDLCVGHASRITAPRGWELVRHPGPLTINPDEDDLVALADAVREGRGVLASRPPVNGFSDPAGHHAAAPVGVPSAGVLAPTAQPSTGTGRRRGHLRVLPDPPREQPE